MSAMWESVRIALRGLVTNKVRAALTMLGIIIGVTAVIALVSVGKSFETYINSEFENLGTNLLFVSFDGRNNDNPQALTTGDAELLADPLAVSGAEATAPVYQGTASASYGGLEDATTVIGTIPDYLGVRSYEMVVGRNITDEEVAHRGRVAVLGATVAEDFFPDNAYPIGETVRLNGIAFEVIGVLAEKGSSGPMDNDNMVLIPLDTAQTRLFSAESVRGEYELTSIVVQARSEDDMDAVQEDISLILRERHRIGVDEFDDFQITNQADIMETVGNITGVLTMVLGAIAAISLLVGGIGIMNIMLVSVTERTREIGLRKAIGAGQIDILSQFLVEAMFLSLAGGLIGIGLGLVASQALGPVLNLEMSVTADTMALAAGFSAAVGLFFGIYPAWRAAKLNPIDALRYE